MQYNLITSTEFLESDYVIQITCNQLLPSSVCGGVDVTQCEWLNMAVVEKHQILTL